MLTQICQYLRNWFERDKIFGSFKVANGTLTYADGTAPPLLPGQYFRVVGSIFNDGVHKIGNTSDQLIDEPEFSGAVWAMAVPPVVAALADEIAAWVAENASVISNPLQSETVGGYSRTFRGGGTAANGEATGLTWQAQFAAQLAPWRKI